MTERKCPDCGDRLSFDAMRCMCGWGQKKAGAKHHDMRCTYKAGATRCNYPVSMFVEGNTTGWCIFHRQQLSQAAGSDVVADSYSIAYPDAIKSLTDRAKNAPGVVGTAHDIAKRHGSKAWQAGNEKFLSEAARGGNEEAA